MLQRTFLFIHKDHPINVVGVNSGAEIATMSLARALAKRGHRVVIAGILADGERVHEGVEYWDIGSRYSTLQALTRARILEPYVLICAGRAQGLIESLDEKNCLLRLLVSHDRTSNDTGIAARTLAQVADAVVCVSHAQESFFLKDGIPPSKVRVITNGTDHQVFAAASPETRDYSKIVFAGALVPDKGVHWLVNSDAQLKRKYPALTLDIFGSSALWGREPMFDEKELQKALPGLIFHGARPQSDIAAAYQKAGICAVPSIWFDPFPLTSIEAQVTGCPVITFNVGGLAEGVIPGKTGVVIEDISPEALTSGLDAMLCERHLLQQMSENALLHQRPKYCWDLVASRFEEMCTELSDGSSPSQTGLEHSPRISVGIVTYNRPTYLAEALESVRRQSTPPFETIVVNDGSSNETADFLAKMQRTFPENKLKVINLPRNSGRPAARNEVVKAMSGDYLLWLDDDDTLDQNAIELAMIDIVNKPNADIIHGNVTVCDQFMKPLGQRQLRAVPRKELLLHLVHENIISNNGTIIRRLLFDRIGLYHPDFPRGQDYEFFARAAVANAEFYHNGRSTCNIRQHRTNQSNPLETRHQSAHQCAIIKTILNSAQLSEIFPQFNWTDQPQESVAQSLATLARIFFDHNDGDTAIELIETALKYSESHTLQLMRAYYLRSLSRFEESSNIFAEVIANLESTLAPLNVIVGAPRGSEKIAKGVDQNTMLI